MSESTIEERTTDEHPVTERVVPVEREVREVRVDASRPSRVRPFIAGFITAALVAAAGILVFLAVSSADDDGTVEVDVPAVEVDVGG
jgi:hypothetical protein